MREFPNQPDLLALIPDTDKIDIKKLTNRCITTDTCNSARKMRRILVDVVLQIDGGVVHEQDCFNHLRNVWINGVVKAVSRFMNEYLKDSLDNISSFLRDIAWLGAHHQGIPQGVQPNIIPPKRPWRVFLRVDHHELPYGIFTPRQMSQRQLYGCHMYGSRCCLQ